jgi:hypothetical protein
MKSGRPSKYESNVKPRFAEIKEWLKAGATDKEIAENLGVNPKVLCRYKNQFSDLNELFKNGRITAVQEIKAALFKRATGFQYTEKKTITKQITLKGIDDCDLPAVQVQTEVYEKYSVPDPASAMILLKHWDKEMEWTQDPATLKLKKQELELKKKHMENMEW